MTRDEFLEWANSGDNVEVIGRNKDHGKKGVIVDFSANSYSAIVQFDDGKERCINHRNLNLLKLNRKIGKVMKIWTNTTFVGRYPTGTAALVIAETSKRAAELLNEKLVSINLQGDIEAKDMFSVSTNSETCIILKDGDY